MLYQFFLQRFVRSNIAMNWGISQGETPMALPVWPFFGNVRHPILEVNHFDPCPFLMWIEMGTPFTTPMSLAGLTAEAGRGCSFQQWSQVTIPKDWKQNQRPPSLPTTYGLAHSVP